MGEVTVPSEDHPTSPKQPHLVYGGIPNSMRVMYVSSSNNPSPLVKYWKSDDPEIVSISNIGYSFTYNQMQMCEEPANILAQNLYRNPGKNIFVLCCVVSLFVCLNGLLP